MTFTVNIQGHDDLAGEAKEAFENGLVAKVVELVADIKGGAGITISNAKVSTNTTGEVDAAAATEGNAGGGEEAPAIPVDEAEAASSEPPTEGDEAAE
jgi:hypothetical protein